MRKSIKKNKQTTQGFTWFSQNRLILPGGGLELLHYDGEKTERIMQGVLNNSRG